MNLGARPPDRREPDGLARVLTNALLGIGAPFVRQLVAGVVLIALIGLVLPLAVLVFVATGLLFFGVLAILGTPTGALGAALGLTWFGGSLALIGWLAVQGWRRIAVIRVIVGFATDDTAEEPTPSVAWLTGDPRADSATLLQRVASADAHLAGSAGDPGGDTGTTSPPHGDDRTYQ